MHTLLTGRAPVQGNDLEEVLRKVQKGEITRVRSIDPTMPQPLEAICLKAMALNSADRYATAGQLADDLDRWLADEPVSAWREPLRVRARRWVRRHRTLMTAGLAFLLTAVVALAISAIFLSWAKNRTETARRVAVDNEKEAKRQTEIAKANEAQAKRQRQRAEANFAKVLAAADKYWLTQVAENTQSENQNHPEQLIRRLLDDAQIFYQGLTDDKDDNSLTEFERARFYTVMGFIHLQSGRSAQAQRMLRQAIIRYEKLVADFPQMPDYRRKLAVSNLYLGQALEASHQPILATAAYRTAVELDPKNAFAHSNLGWALNGWGRYNEAISILRKAIALDPKNAYAHANLGYALDQKGQYDEAIPILRNAIALDPKNALAHANLGYALDQKGQYDEAIPILRNAIALDPKNALAHANLGYALDQKGQYDEAIPILRNAIALDPKNALAHANLGYALDQKGQYDEAIPILRNAIAWTPRTLLLTTTSAYA